MEKITSFTIDHIKLQPGVYVSRKDQVGESTITTFDLRMTSPNEEPVMNTAEVHTIEHLAATFLRNHKTYGSKTIYFGPKDCGNYLDMNLGMANYLAARFLDNVLYRIDETRLVYPE